MDQKTPPAGVEKKPRERWTRHAVFAAIFILAWGQVVAAGVFVVKVVGSAFYSAPAPVAEGPEMVANATAALAAVGAIIAAAWHQSHSLRAGGWIALFGAVGVCAALFDAAFIGRWNAWPYFDPQGDGPYRLAPHIYLPLLVIAAVLTACGLALWRCSRSRVQANPPS